MNTPKVVILPQTRTRGRWTAEFQRPKPVRVEKAELPTPLPAYSEGADGITVAEYSQMSKDWRVWDIAWLLLRIGLKLYWLRMTERGREGAARDYAVIELYRLGGLWLEFGRILAQEPSWLERRMSIRVERPTMDFDYIDRLFLREFSTPLDEVFSKFDRQPSAVGALFEIHRAELRDSGVEVEVHVRRRGTLAVLARDERIVRWLAWIGKELSSGSEIVLPGVMQELKDQLAQMADARFVASNLKGFKKSLRRQEGFVPNVVFAHSSSRFLVTEPIGAPTLADWVVLHNENPELALEWLRANDIDREQLGQRLTACFLEHFLERERFPANLSPENIQLLRGSAFALKPMPRFATTDRRYQTAAREMLRCIAHRDHSKAVDYLLLLCDKVPSHRLSAIRSELIRMHRSFDARLDLHRTVYAERSYSKLSLEMAVVLQRHGVVRNTQSIVAGQAWINFEDTIQHLLPEVNLREELKRYFRRADQRRLRRVRSQGVRKTLANVMNAVSEQWGFIDSQLRRRSQVFTRLNRVAYAAASLMRVARKGFVLLMIVGILARLRVFDLIPGFTETRIGRLSESVLFWRFQELLMIGFLGIVVFRLAIRWMSDMAETAGPNRL